MKRLILIREVVKTDCGNININEEDIDMDYFSDIDKDNLTDVTDDNIDVRGTGEFKGKALWLDPGYEYVLGRDKDSIILVPLKKK